MAIRLVNKGKADCDINLHNGRTVRLKPSSYITLGEEITQDCKEYYRQLRDFGLYLEQFPAPGIEKKVEEVQKEPEVTSVDGPEQVNAVEPESEVVEKPEEEKTPTPEITVESLMKHTKSELIEIATSYDLTDLDGLSKKQIADKIMEVYGI